MSRYLYVDRHVSGRDGTRRVKTVQDGLDGDAYRVHGVEHVMVGVPGTGKNNEAELCDPVIGEIHRLVLLPVLRLDERHVRLLLQDVPRQHVGPEAVLDVVEDSGQAAVRGTQRMGVTKVPPLGRESQACLDQMDQRNPTDSRESTSHYRKN